MSDPRLVGIEELEEGEGGEALMGSIYGACSIVCVSVFLFERIDA